MTRPRALLIGCACLALVTSLGAAPPATPAIDLEKENAELRKQVGALQRRVRALQKQLDERRERTREDRFIIPPRFAPREGPGEGWIPKQFNGRTYYLIPCDSNVESTVTAPMPKHGAATLIVPTTMPASVAPIPAPK